MRFFILISISIITSTSFAFDGVYKLDVERNGVTHKQVAGNFWQGEYPGPVIDINSRKNGKTTIQGWTSLRKLNKRKTCTVNNAIYHPWAEVTPNPSSQKNSVINYYTIAPVMDYKVIKTLTPEILQSIYESEKLNIQPGDQIVNLFYLSEGASTATLIQGEKETQIELSWDTLEQAPEYFALTLQTEALDEIVYEDGTIEKRREQWLYLACSEGYNVFVQDKDLLTQKGVKEGTIVGYGEIKAAK